MMNICNKYEFIIILICVIGLIILTYFNKLDQQLFVNLFSAGIGYAIKGKVEKVKIGDNNGK